MKPYYTEPGIEIYLGDCREILPTLDPVDLVLTDPPYGFNRFKSDGKNYLGVVGPALTTAFSIIPEGGSMFVFSGTGEVINLANAIKANFKRMLWMYKPADCTYPLHGWLLKSEAILWFMREGKSNLFDRHPFRHDCYIHNRVGMEGVEGHPTVKPLSVISDFVMRCPENGITLDPFMGSGTTLRAAKDLGRKAIGIEIEEKYCEMAAKRLQQEVFDFIEQK